jgi:hypothetical protein
MIREVDISSELSSRACRPRDYEAEHRSMGRTRAGMAVNPRNMLQKLAETALELCSAETAGVSLLEIGDGQELFRWEALAGTCDRDDRAAQLQPIRLHSNSEGENYSGFDADSRRRDARLIFRFNRRPDSQAGRRGFDPRLPLLYKVQGGIGSVNENEPVARPTVPHACTRPSGNIRN